VTRKNKILYAEDLVELREIYSMAIEAELDCEVVEFDNGNDLLKYLQSHDDVQMVLCDHNMPNGTGSDVYRYMKEAGIKLPFGLISSDSPAAHSEFKTFSTDHPLNFALVKPFEMAELVQKIRSGLGIKHEVTLPEYCAIKMERFEKYNPIAADVYIRVDDNRYVKIRSMGEMFSSEHHGKHQEKYGQYLYIPGDQYPRFLAVYQEQIKNILSIKNIGPQIRISAELHGLELVHNYVNAMGIDLSLVKNVDVLHDSILESVKNHPSELTLLMSQMAMGKNGYLYEHSLLLSYLCCGIAEQAGWKNETIFKKLVIASLFHDVGLDDELSRVDRYSQIIEKRLNMVDSKKVMDHPQRVAKLIRMAADFPPDTDQIILAHHENPEGKSPEDERHLQAQQFHVLPSFRSNEQHDCNQSVSVSARSSQKRF